MLAWLEQLIARLALRLECVDGLSIGVCIVDVCATVVPVDIAVKLPRLLMVNF